MRCVAWLLPFQHEGIASGVAGWGFAGSTECSLLTLLSVVPSEQAALVHVDQLLFPGSNSRSSLQSIYWLSYVYCLTALKTVSSLADPSDCPYVRSWSPLGWHKRCFSKEDSGLGKQPFHHLVSAYGVPNLTSPQCRRMREDHTSHI